MEIIYFQDPRFTFNLYHRVLARRNDGTSRTAPCASATDTRIVRKQACAVIVPT